MAYLDGRDPVELARLLCAGGADLIQLRGKQSSPDELCRLAESILPVTDQAGVGLVINDYPDVARRVGAWGCHLGQEDFFDAGHQAATEITRGSPTIRLGLSTHSPAQAERAQGAGPDYVAVGPIHATPTKPGRPGVTLDLVRWACGHLTIPWVAIGGITLENLDAVLEAGARRVAVVSAILRAPDVLRACQAFKERVLSAPLD
jgi:thiamine-phosphate pyrophosphorylase